MTTLDVTFAGAWLCDPTDPSTRMQVFRATRGTAAANLNGSQVRTYAGGRRRIITTPADEQTVALVLRRVTDTQFATLLGWRGRLLLFRDYQGWRRFGTFFAVGESSVFRGVDLQPVHNVTLTWTDADYSEGV